jgi:hypothetical protein
MTGWYTHLKTGNRYFVLAEVTNSTNGNNGQAMVLYRNEAGQFFVREKEEFEQKFVKETP